MIKKLSKLEINSIRQQAVRARAVSTYGMLRTSTTRGTSQRPIRTATEQASKKNQNQPARWS